MNIVACDHRFSLVLARYWRHLYPCQLSPVVATLVVSLALARAHEGPRFYVRKSSGESRVAFVPNRRELSVLCSLLKFSSNAADYGCETISSRELPPHENVLHNSRHLSLGYLIFVKMTPIRQESFNKSFVDTFFATWCNI